ncbi:MAG: ATP-dependent helicase HrpB [Wenzhouxiangellaceae bacterium]|nr:ATP-dependent helicase HrpB [Wenzhouxiangellaceae bacterium]
MPEPELPITGLLPTLLTTLEQHSVAVLQAPPGAGKTTTVPPALLKAGWRAGRRIVMLEPRRLAARAAACFMAGRLGEPVGATVGFRTRLETRVSDTTRIEIVTEGILIRMLQRDPELSGHAAVLFDEFHERSLDADLGLALVREVQQALRPDLRVVVMSATLDTAPLAKLLGDAPVLSTEGRSFPVDIVYRPPRRERNLPNEVAGAVRHALDQESGSILVFLPGAREIRAVAHRLEALVAPDLQVRPLFGAMKPEAQDAAIAPPPDGTRKVVLATSIAETSLTIEGVRVVVDAGRERRARFDPGSGMTRLVTTRVSQAASEQRRGRAGRIEPGVCYRLWSEAEQRRLPKFTPPEILEADLAPMVLELAHWGAQSPGELVWLNPPPEAHWQQAVELLQWLDALDGSGAITAAGREMLAAGVHPRLAHMLVLARAHREQATAARLAAVLSERDLLESGEGADLEARLALLDRPGRGRVEQVRKLARRLGADERTPAGTPEPAEGPIGPLLALAFPDRVARRRPGGRPRYLLSNGRGAWLPGDDPLAASEWLVAADLDGEAREARIFLAARTGQAEIESVLHEHIETTEHALWDDERGTVVVRRERRLGAIVLESREAGRPTPEHLAEGLLDAIRQRGLKALDWNDAARQFCARAELVRAELHPDWPAFDRAALARELPDWLGPFLAGLTHLHQVEKLDPMPALTARLGFERARELDRLAPSRVEVPAGPRVRLDYTAESGPVLAVKLQAVFGWRETPRIAGGRVPVVLHLLDPAGRPLAVTSTLESFWRNAYPDIARDMRGRYPKHPWPEEPLAAKPTLATKRQ